MGKTAGPPGEFVEEKKECLGPTSQFTPVARPKKKKRQWRPTLSGPRFTRTRPTLREIEENAWADAARPGSVFDAHTDPHASHTFLTPPHHTRSLQPVAETRAKQSALWRDLVLAYCRAKRVWTVTADGGDGDELFSNRAIERKFLLVERGCCG